jgi:hypothetical protein
MNQQPLCSLTRPDMILPFESERFGHVYHAKFRNVDLVAIGVELVIGKANPPRSFFPGADGGEAQLLQSSFVAR